MRLSILQLAGQPPPTAPSRPRRQCGRVRGSRCKGPLCLTAGSDGHAAAASTSRARSRAYTLPQTPPQALSAPGEASPAARRCAAAQSLPGARAHGRQPAAPPALSFVTPGGLGVTSGADSRGPRPPPRPQRVRNPGQLSPSTAGGDLAVPGPSIPWSPQKGVSGCGRFPASGPRPRTTAPAAEREALPSAKRSCPPAGRQKGEVVCDAAET